jgi:hypothetical protein
MNCSLLTADIKGVADIKVVTPVLSVRKLFSKSPYQACTVAGGELIKENCDDNMPFTHYLSRDRSVYLNCEPSQVAQLQLKEMRLLSAIKEPAERLNTFKEKLGWGTGLKQGSRVLITLPENKRKRVEGIVHYRGLIKASFLFGVEILVSN